MLDRSRTRSGCRSFLPTHCRLLATALSLATLTLADSPQRGFRFAACDLDGQWPEELLDPRPDAICAIEVIEHLKSPWKRPGRLQRPVASRVEYWLFSTPNISSVWGRTYFLLQGVPLGFSKRNMLAIGHINPLTFQEIAPHCRVHGI